MNVLSLFDGMACGMLAMITAGIKVDRYVAYEIDKYAVQTSTHNFPFIEHKGDVFTADFTEYADFDFLVGGSPCTYWSIAQTKNRETVASGMGWELFSQYVRALHESKPKYFIYENNKSMSKEIRKSITETFGFEPVCINSALVSAQNRQRLYWVGIRTESGTYRPALILQPEDCGILLKDILETNAIPYQEKADVLTASYDGAVIWNSLERHQRSMVAEPIAINTLNDEGEKARTLMAGYYKYGTATLITNEGFKGGTTAEFDDFVTEFEIKDGVYEKANRCYDAEGEMSTLTTSSNDNIIAPVSLEQKDCCSFSIPHSWNDGIFAYDKFANLTTGSCSRQQNVLIEKTDKTQEEIGKPQAFCNKIYEVKGGMITVKGKQYPIKLVDGYYIIRKLTVLECMRLQTVPEWYEFPVSKSQAYKMLGNGWTVEVIAHLINSLKGEISNVG